MLISRGACPNRRQRDHVREIERGDRRLADVGVGVAGQRPQPGLHRIDTLRHAGEVASLNDFLDLAQLLVGDAGIVVPHRHGGGNEGLPDRVGSEFLQRCVGIHGLVVGVGVEQGGRLVGHHLLQDRGNRFPLGKPLPPDFCQQSGGLTLVEHDRAGRPPVGKGEPIEIVQNPRGRDGRESDYRQHAQMRIPKHRLEAADQGLVGQHRVEIHRNFRHANTLALGRNSRMQIGQRFLVIEPSDLGHKSLDQPKHTLGAVDESTLYFVSIRVFVTIAPLVEETFGARGVFWRGQIEKGEEITRFIMRALLLKFRAALNVDQGRCHIREISFGIFAGGMTLRLDEDSPARAEATQCVVQSPGDADEFGRHGGIQVRPPKPRGALKRAILVEDNSLVDQSSPGQEIRKLRRRTPIFPEVHHHFKRSNGWRCGDDGARRRRTGGRASPPTPRRLGRESRARGRRATAADRGRAPPPGYR